MPCDQLTIHTPGQKVADEYYRTNELTKLRLARLIDAEISATMQENAKLRRALWYISVSSMPPGDDWCEVPVRVARYAEIALEESRSEYSAEIEK